MLCPCDVQEMGLPLPCFLAGMDSEIESAALLALKSQMCGAPRSVSAAPLTFLNQNM